MMEKIEWYKEVLELEPNSKVFFPLARLLAKENLYSEAEAQLEKGLERHPEFLEARLFLIEILFATKQQEKCEAEVRKLDKMFATYSGFWQAWAACLAQQRDEEDTASIMRFLAAKFVSGPLQLHDVLNKGVMAILQEKGFDFSSNIPSPQAPEKITASSQTETQISEERVEITTNPETSSDQCTPLTTQESLNIEEADVSVPTPAQASDKIEETATADEIENGQYENISQATPNENDDFDKEKTQYADSGVEDEKLAAQASVEIIDIKEKQKKPGAKAKSVEVNSASSANLKSSTEEEVIKAEKNILDEMALPEDGDPGASLPLVEQMALPDEDAQEEKPVGQDSSLGYDEISENSLPPKEEPSDSLSETDINMGNKLESDVSSNSDSMLNEENEDDNTEKFSLRTKSMADVLAEQGDIQSALDIYEELAAATSEPEEAEELGKKIANLKTRLNTESTTADQEAVSKEKLIDMLEALAHRVEERVNNPVELS